MTRTVTALTLEENLLPIELPPETGLETGREVSVNPNSLLESENTTTPSTDGSEQDEPLIESRITQQLPKDKYEDLVPAA